MHKNFNIGDRNNSPLENSRDLETVRGGKVVEDIAAMKMKLERLEAERDRLKEKPNGSNRLRDQIAGLDSQIAQLRKSLKIS